jgi:hypothetical protein
VKCTVKEEEEEAVYELNVYARSSLWVDFNVGFDFSFGKIYSWK